MKFKHTTLILIAGFVWLAIGILLLSLGLNFLLDTLKDPGLTHIAGKFSISNACARFSADPTKRVILIITAALLLGYMKGKMALGKSVKRQINRIEALPNPASLKYLYGKGYYALIALMISLGVLLRYLPITLDTRGAIDVVIGSALINGARLYFQTVARYAYLKKRA